MATTTTTTATSSEEKELLGGPGKCGLLFIKYWKDLGKDPLANMPDVDIKFKVYRLSDFDPTTGTFYIDFILMLDWADESLSLAADNVPNFEDHFWPKAELMNLAPDNDDLDFGEKGFMPKYKRDKSNEFGSVHRATITLKARRTLYARLDFHQFPFDKQVLELTVKLLSVRIPGLSAARGVRPKANHPKRWRGKTGHEL